MKKVEELFFSAIITSLSTNKGCFMKKTIFTLISAIIFAMFSTYAGAADYRYNQRFSNSSSMTQVWKDEANRYLGGNYEMVSTNSYDNLIQDFKVVKDPQSRTLFFVVDGQENARVKVKFNSSGAVFRTVELQEVERGRYVGEYSIREVDELFRKDFAAEMRFGKRTYVASYEAGQYNHSNNSRYNRDERPDGGYVSADQWRPIQGPNQPYYQGNNYPSYPVVPNGGYGQVQPNYPAPGYPQRNYDNSGYGYNQRVNVNNGVVVKVEVRDGGDNLTGAAIGALAGGVLGNQVGKGSGRDAATILGVIGGGLVGNEMGKNQQGGRMWFVHVRFDDGSTNVFNFNQDPMVSVGTYVMRDGNNLIRR